MRALESIESRLLRLRKIKGEHWLFIGTISSNGYGNIWYNGKKEFVHRLAAMLWLGYKLDDKEHQINHKLECSYKNCFNPGHIYIGTHIENMRDMIVD